MDLTTRKLSDTEKKVLSLGPKFRPSLPKIPLDEYIIATETYFQMNKLEPEAAAYLRTTVQHHLNNIIQKTKYSPPKCNLSKNDWAAIKALKNYSTIIIIPADKGNKTVVMDRIKYEEQFFDRIQTHIKINYDPTSRNSKSINDAINCIHKTKPRKTCKQTKDAQPLILTRTNITKFKI